MAWKKNAKLSSRQKKRLHQLAFQFLRINSTNPKGNTRLAKFAAERLRRLGFQIRFQKARFCGVPQVNLLARMGPMKKRPIVINTHLDTVTTEAKAWTKTGGNPFRPTVHRGRLYGLGSADTKLALACQLIALEDLGDLKFRRPLVLTGTYGEEMGLVGVRDLMGSRWVQKADVLNSEPTELHLAIGNRGFRILQIRGKFRSEKKVSGTIYTVRFQGKAAHSGMQEKGVNALLQAIAWLEKQGKAAMVLGLEGGLAPNIVAPSCLMKVLISNGKINGLKPFWGKVESKKRKGIQGVFPGSTNFLKNLKKFLKRHQRSSQSSNLGMMTLNFKKMEFHLDHRFNHKVDPQPYLKALRHFLRDQSTKSDGKYVLKVERQNPAFYQSPKGPFIGVVKGVLKSLGKAPQIQIKPGCTEAGYFAQKGCQVLTVGPGRAYGNVHQPNESVRLKELEDATVFYREIIRELCM